MLNNIEKKNCRIVIEYDLKLQKYVNRLICLVLGLVFKWIGSRKPQTDWITLAGGFYFYPIWVFESLNIRLHACEFELFHFRLWAIYFKFTVLNQYYRSEKIIFKKIMSERNNESKKIHYLWAQPKFCSMRCMKRKPY